MPSSAEKVPAKDKPQKSPDVATAALEYLHKTLDRPERKKLSLLLRSFTLPFIVALFPLFAALGGGFLAPDVPPPELSIAQLEALETIEDPDERAATELIDDAGAAYRLYRNQLALLGASVILAGFVMMSIQAQTQLIHRHWTAFIKPLGYNTASAPRRATYGAAVIILVLVFALTPQISLPGPLEGLLPELVLLAGAFLGVAAMTLAFVTLMGAFIVAENYPGVKDADSIALRFERARLFYDVKDPVEVLAIAMPKDWAPEGYEAPPKSPTKKEEEAAVAAELKAMEDGKPALAAVLNVSWGLSGEDSIGMINSLCLILATTFVLTLVVMSLTGAAFVGAVGGPEQFSADLRAALDAWVVFVGLGASATLAVAYIFPVLRLMPYQYAEAQAKEEKAKKKPRPAKERPWNITGSFGLSGVNLTAKREPAEKEEKPYDVFEAHGGNIGVSEEKFRAILAAANLGGAFHSLTKDTLTTHIRSLLTIIAPAAAGTILSLLG